MGDLEVLRNATKILLAELEEIRKVKEKSESLLEESDKTNVAFRNEVHLARGILQELKGTTKEACSAFLESLL